MVPRAGISSNITTPAARMGIAGVVVPHGGTTGNTAAPAARMGVAGVTSANAALVLTVIRGEGALAGRAACTSGGFVCGLAGLVSQPVKAVEASSITRLGPFIRTLVCSTHGAGRIGRVELLRANDVCTSSWGCELQECHGDHC